MTQSVTAVRQALFFSLLLLASALAGPPASAAAPPGRLKLRDCYVTDQVSKQPVTARCGRLLVLEDRRRPNGRTIPLDVVVLPAKERVVRLPIYFLPGGPGQRTTGLVPGFAASPMRANHDLVFMDIRGAGKQDPLTCDVGGTDADPQSYLEPLFSQGRAFARCRDQLLKRADLNQYTAVNAMRDLDQLRVALGHRDIMISAESYGTRTALVYIRLFGKHVKGALLGGAAPFENRLPLNHAAAAQRAFEKVTAECRATPSCAAAFPDMGGDLATVLDRLHAKPAKVTVTNPADNQPLKVTLTADSFAEGLRVMLYYDDTIREIPLLLHGAVEGHLEAFAQAALNGNRALYSIPLGMLLSFTCSEDVARIKPSEIASATAGSFIGDARIKGQIAACSVWPRHRVAPEYLGTFRSKVPVLIVSGSLDPVTPPSDGEIARRYFPNSLHLIFDGGHGTGGDCLESISANFFDTANLQKLDTQCVGRMPGPNFALPGSVPTGASGS